MSDSPATAPARAPEFPESLVWLFTKQPPKLEELSGHVILLYFWSSSCVHSAHLHQSLEFLAAHFVDRSLQVLAVHSGKMPAERSVEHAQHAALRAGLHCPVAVDQDMQLWTDYACHAWPTLVVIDAQGFIRFRGSGEPDRARLQQAIHYLLEEGEESDCYPESQVLVTGPAQPLPRGGLRFPSGLCVDANQELLWISDSGNHRLLGVGLADGRVQHVVGRGFPGCTDATGADAAFFRPGGLIADERHLYVADTGNHLLRRVHRDTWFVETLVGQGRQVQDLEGGEAGRLQGLSSPVGICAAGPDELLFSNAGSHQVWRLEKTSMTGFPEAGHGGVELEDGPALQAAVAQPAGLAVHADGRRLAIADSDANAVRLLVRGGELSTLAGAGPFHAGDIDGALHEARLQQPRDVVWWRLGDADVLLVADTLNHKIKLLDPAQKVVHTLFGPEHGLRLPESLALHGDRLFVCDAGNHRVMAADLSQAEPRLEEFELQAVPSGPGVFGTDLQECELIRLEPFVDADLRLPLCLPLGCRPHPDVPVTLALSNLEGQPLAVDLMLVLRVTGDQAAAEGIAVGETAGVALLELDFLACQQPDGAVYPFHLRWRLPIDVQDNVGMEAEVRLRSE